MMLAQDFGARERGEDAFLPGYVCSVGRALLQLWIAEVHDHALVWPRGEEAKGALLDGALRITHAHFRPQFDAAIATRFASTAGLLVAPPSLFAPRRRRRRFRWSRGGLGDTPRESQHQCSRFHRAQRRPPISTGPCPAVQ